MAASSSAYGACGRLQRAIPIAVIDVDGADLDAVLARIAHQLCRLIKPHRLAIEDGGAEHIRITAFDVGRGINQKRKTRRMTFGKTIFAEAFDLAETILGKIAVIAASHHAVDEFIAK